MRFMGLEPRTEQGRQRQPWRSAIRKGSSTLKFALFKRTPSRGWFRFTSVALPLDEAMKTWPDLPGDFCIRPINPQLAAKGVQPQP